MIATAYYAWLHAHHFVMIHSAIHHRVDQTRSERMSDDTYTHIFFSSLLPSRIFKCHLGCEKFTAQVASTFISLCRSWLCWDVFLFMLFLLTMNFVGRGRITAWNRTYVNIFHYKIFLCFFFRSFLTHASFQGWKNHNQKISLLIFNDLFNVIFNLVFKNLN